MSGFEYLWPLVTILVGLSIADLTGSLHRIMRARRRVVWHWLPLVAAAMVLLVILQLWWQLRRLPFVTEIWSYYWAFLIVTANLVAIYLLASAALPDDIPEEGLCLKDYYFQNAPYFWSVFAVSAALVAMMQVVPIAYVLIAGIEADITLIALGIASNVVAIVLNLTLAVVRRPRFHLTLVPLLFMLFLFQWSGLNIA